MSFVELLNVPTTGVSSLKAADLSTDHLDFLMHVVDRGTAKCVFLSPRVSSILRQTKVFPWLRQTPSRMDGDLAVVRERNGQIIYQMYHLSCYGWQLNVLNRQISQIRKIVESL